MIIYNFRFYLGKYTWYKCYHFTLSFTNCIYYGVSEAVRKRTREGRKQQVSCGRLLRSHLVSSWGCEVGGSGGTGRSPGSPSVGGVGATGFHWCLAAVKYYLDVFCLASLHRLWYLGWRQQAFLRICFVSACWCSGFPGSGVLSLEFTRQDDSLGELTTLTFLGSRGP